MFPRPKYLFLDDRGTTTIEYAVCVIAAAALAGLLLIAVQSESIQEGIADLFDQAFTVNG